MALADLTTEQRFRFVTMLLRDFSPLAIAETLLLPRADQKTFLVTAIQSQRAVNQTQVDADQAIAFALSTE